MKILIDADACPVVDIAVGLCKEFNRECLLFCDTAHQMRREWAQTILADKGADSVDFMLVNKTLPGDVVITQDYGLASMCLARGARVLHQDGWEYTRYNIDALLFQRHAAREYRASGGRTKGPSKRKNTQNEAFATAFRQILKDIGE